MKPIHLSVLTLIVAGIISYATAKAVAPTVISPPASATAEPKPKKSDESVYKRVMRTGKIRCGYASYPPSFYMDSNTGKFSGVMYDLTEEIANLLSLEVEWTEEASYGTMAAGLKANRYDAICSGKWIYAPQAREADFSNGIFFTTVNAYTRQNDNRFDGNIELLNSPDYIISSIDGTYTADVARINFPNAKKVSLPALTEESQSFLDLISNKVDVAFADTAIAGNFLVHNENAIRRIKNIDPIYAFETAYMFKKNEFEFKSAINIALRELHTNGTIERLIKKHEKYPGSFTPFARPYEVTKGN